MVALANPDSSEPIPEPATHPQTVEFRLADCSADVHLLLAGMAVAARWGLSDPKSLERAARLSTADHEDFEKLPSSSADSADALESERASFEADGVFHCELIDALVDRLRAYDDATLLKKVAKDDDARAQLVRRHWHVGDPTCCRDRTLSVLPISSGPWSTAPVVTEGARARH
jgi:glutamine synthetase